MRTIVRGWYRPGKQNSGNGGRARAVHSRILHPDHLLELRALSGGRMVVRLKDARKTELPVFRERAAALKVRLGL
jgi:hypothetical protein